MYEDMEKFTKLASKQLKLGKCQCRTWDLSHGSCVRIPTVYQLPDLGKAYRLLP